MPRPNISGYMSTLLFINMEARLGGAFYKTWVGSASQVSGDIADRAIDVHFDAWKSNGLYDRSNTVQVASIRHLALIRT